MKLMIVLGHCCGTLLVTHWMLELLTSNLGDQSALRGGKAPVELKYIQCQGQAARHKDTGG